MSTSLIVAAIAVDIEQPECLCESHAQLLYYTWLPGTHELVINCAVATASRCGKCHGTASIVAWLADIRMHVMQFYEEACLVRQKFVMGDDQSVQVCKNRLYTTSP